MSAPSRGWQTLLPPPPAGSRGRVARPIPAYSEFMPAPPVGWRPYSGLDGLPPLDPGDPWGWQITEYEEILELRPGLAHLAGELLHSLQRLGRRQPGHGIGQMKLAGNPYWPEPLAGSGAPAHERYLLLAPLALARTQDDKGRVRWTLFGASEQGPERPFWQSFYTAPGQEAPAAQGLTFLRRLVAPTGTGGGDGAGDSVGAAGSGATALDGGGDALAAGVGANAPTAEGAAAEQAAIGDLLASGLRILPGDGGGSASGGGMPSWTAPLLWAEQQPLTGVRHLLTFRPFASLPAAVRGAYLEGRLHLLPFPGSLLFWGAGAYHQLAHQLPFAMQIPLLHPVARSEALHRLRVPQAGWLHEPHADHPSPATQHGPIRNTYKRTHRWARVERTDDELAVGGHEDRMAHVLFSAAADDLGLYGKPMARNSQLWTGDYQLLLDGPHADRAQLAAAAARLAAGGTYGYRFLYPAMRVGEHEVYWHRLLAAVPGAASGPARASGPAAHPADPADPADPTDPAGAAKNPQLPDIPAKPVAAVMVEGAPLGYLTAYAADRPDLAHPVELWPRLLDRPGHRAAAVALDRAVRALHAAGPGAVPSSGSTASGSTSSGSATPSGTEPGSDATGGDTLAPAASSANPLGPAGESAARSHRDASGVRKLLDAQHLLGGAPLPPGFAAALVRLPKGGTLDGWLSDVAVHHPGKAAEAARAAIAAEPAELGAPPLTFRHTANRSFEVTYWQCIAFLATGRFVNKDNADCVRDPATQRMLSHPQRDLDALADYLIDHYRRRIADCGMSGQALVGDLPFRWQTDFDFNWSGGWLGNRQGELEERNVMVVIPGRDRSRAIIMADHYDTAYMEDRYGYQQGGHGPRLAAAGADDNHSATAALMLGAPIFMELAQAGKLDCDIWLVHLTGEEFPSDCLGARHLTQSLLEGTLRLRLPPAAAAGAEIGVRPGDAAVDGARGARMDAGPGAVSVEATGGAEGEAAGEPAWVDLSGTRVAGVYVLDMIAHNNDRRRDVFQMCPGAGAPSMWLALQAHLANRAWNELAPAWNRSSRRGCTRGRRSADGKTMPAKALHPTLHGEVRPQSDPHSTLYNTDGQIFSDAGVPVVLFMENYDINRHGYHDSHDTLENIDLDYGAAVAAIAIESVARAAASAGPGGAATPPPRT